MSKIKIVKKILKLMALKKSAEKIKSLGEAAACERQIKFLREKYSITEELIYHHQETGSDRDDRELVFNIASPLFRKKRVVWQEMIFIASCTYFEVQGMMRKNSNLKIVFGEKDVRRPVVKSYLHLHPEAEKLADRYIQKLKDSGELDAKDSRTKRQSFLLGFADGISQRLRHYKQLEAEIIALRKSLEMELPGAVAQAQTANLLNAGSDEPSVETESSTALIKSEKIVIYEESPRNNPHFDETRKPQKPPKSDIKEFDHQSLISGSWSGANCGINAEITKRAEAAAKTLGELREKKKLRDDEERKRNWEQNFLNHVSPFGYSRYRAQTATFQFNFDFYDED